jgi:hypothetical protein
MIDCDYLLSILCDQGDGAVAVPLRNQDTPCLVAAALDGDHIIGTPLLSNRTATLALRRCRRSRTPILTVVW